MIETYDLMELLRDNLLSDEVCEALQRTIRRRLCLCVSLLWKWLLAPALSRNEVQQLVVVLFPASERYRESDEAP